MWLKMDWAENECVLPLRIANIRKIEIVVVAETKLKEN